METSISKFFGDLEDPRIDRKKLYPLEEVLLVALCCIISGGEGFRDMELYGNSKLDFLRKIYLFEHGIASHDTFSRVFQVIDPNAFKKAFVAWVKDLSQRTQRSIAIDGKLARRTHSKTQKALNMVSAWGHEEGLVLAQEAVKKGSNEIPAIEELLGILDLKSAVVTIDAIGCQKSITKRIVEDGGDYIIGLKSNQKTVHNDVKKVFQGEKEVRFLGNNFSEYETIEKDHGRIETRQYRAISVMILTIDVNEWPGIKSLIEVKSIREINEKRSEETRYYISSLEAQAKKLGRGIRGHWGIENGLHWVLDVVFREDDSRIRTGNAPENIGIVT